MIKLILASFLALSAQTVSASEIIYFCDSIEIVHSGVQFMRIENSDDFKLESKGKYSHALIAKTTQPAYTSLSMENGHQFNEYTFEQDCSVKQKKIINLEN